MPSTIASAEPPAAAAVAVPCALAVGAPVAVDQAVAHEERAAAREEADRHGGAPVRRVEGLGDELVGHGADQDAAAEAHHEPQGAAG